MASGGGLQVAGFRWAAGELQVGFRLALQWASLNFDSSGILQLTFQIGSRWGPGGLQSNLLLQNGFRFGFGLFWLSVLDLLLGCGMTLAIRGNSRRSCVRSRIYLWFLRIRDLLGVFGFDTLSVFRFGVPSRAAGRFSCSKR